MCDLLDQIGAANTRTHALVRVPVQVLSCNCAAKHRSPLGGSEVDRLGKVLSMSETQARFLAKAAAVEVAHLQRRVRHRFDIDASCLSLLFQESGSSPSSEIEPSPKPRSLV